MPRYLYRCPECKELREEQRAIADRDKPVRCKSCKKHPECERQAAAPAVQPHVTPRFYR